MSIKVVLFDLDGTLLPMDQDLFIKDYFTKLAKKLAPHGYNPELLMKSVWEGTRAMVKNTGERPNEAVFWDSFAAQFGEKVRDDLPLFEEFYENDFDTVREVCGHNPKAAELISWLRENGVRVALATNPLFPSIATEHRMDWAGLTPDMFELYTTYENSNYCKPNPKYYLEVTEKLGVQPKECIMVGNDVSEDMITRDLGMEVFLLTDCLINKEEADISVYPNGGFEELKKFLGGKLGI